MERGGLTDKEALGKYSSPNGLATMELGSEGANTLEIDAYFLKMSNFCGQLPEVCHKKVIVAKKVASFFWDLV